MSTREVFGAVREEIATVVVGQDAVVAGMITALLVGGHVLLEGVPGTAKTLLVRSLAASLRLETKRVQFTPDLMPSDITGLLVYEQQTGTFAFRPGPVFTNLLMADEINRTPPRTQAALLEAMEERQVSVQGIGRPLPEPFFVVATQNPIEHEGTYPLPDAQLDRFLFKLNVGYPTAEQERLILQRHHEGLNAHQLVGLGIAPQAGPEDILQARREIAQIRVEPEVLAYMVAVVRATRESPSLRLGVSPRGATMLLLAAKAWSWLTGRSFVSPDEIKVVAPLTLGHRVQVRPEVELEGITADTVLRSIFSAIPVPR